MIMLMDLKVRGLLRVRWSVLLSGLIAVSSGGAACSKNFVEPEAAGEVSGGESGGTGGSPAGAPEGIHFQAPAGWVEQSPSSSMREAQYLLPRAQGDTEDAELVVYHFPGQGGSVSSNISRWVGQMTRPDGSPATEDAQISERQVGGREVTLLDVSGSYQGMRGPRSQSAPKPGFRMLGAIVDTDDGPWFFKLTGPAATVAEWSASWGEFVDGFR